MESKPFPHSLKSERALLGGLLQDPSYLTEVASVLKPDDFYSREHGALFGLLRDMADRGDVIDMVSVPERVGREGREAVFGGVSYILGLPEHAPSTSNLPHYAAIVKEKALLRRLIEATSNLREEAHEQPEDVSRLIERAVREMQELGQENASRTWEQISLTIDNELTRIEQLAERAEGLTGTTTGFLDLDDKLAGLQPTDLVILAARPAMGKTALALNIAQNAALMGGKGVGIFSLEMSRGQLVTRMLCCQAMVESGKARTGKLNTEDWERFIEASDHLRTGAIHIDDTPGLTIGEVRGRSRRLKSVVPDLGLIVIDYLQLMSGDDPKEARQQQISNISRGLKGMAKDLGVPVLALSQLNRGVEQRQEKRPLVSDLRESGAIEQDADVIMFLYRDEVYNEDSPDKGLAEVIIAKQRNGPTGTVKLVFQGQYTRFDNYADEEFSL